MTSPMPLRYVAFPNGAVSELRMTRAELERWRASTPRFASALDVTPRPGRVAVHFALGLNPWLPRAETSLRWFPCPACSDGTARWAVCDTCGGSRRLPSLAWR